MHRLDRLQFYSAVRILCFRFEGEVDSGQRIHRHSARALPAGDGTTNVAFGEGEKELYVTVVKDPNDSQAKGSVVKISNVE